MCIILRCPSYWTPWKCYNFMKVDTTDSLIKEIFKKSVKWKDLCNPGFTYFSQGKACVCLLWPCDKKPCNSIWDYKYIPQSCHQYINFPMSFLTNRWGNHCPSFFFLRVSVSSSQMKIRHLVTSLWLRTQGTHCPLSQGYCERKRWLYL